MIQSIKKLLGLSKNLPPEVRMLLTLLGIATPVGAFYALKNWLRLPTLYVVSLLMGAAVVVLVIGMIVPWMFNRGARRRQRQMAYQLADVSSAGPVALDIRAAIKANNDKFFNAIRDMRKNVGLSVYDLPWYIVIGDSGCGKTKLVNEGGLTFSTGKPEGYQLGTLNYNWWFSEDAVFVDMAGRLCNPRDDADRREWEAFLTTIGKGRKGFPINGALVCVSADHLLQDSPERVEQDANTMLERLRDLQTKLGVTFATYLLVTKCDKILGFIPFFERADRDITVKNQIFGWSRPGAFNDLYDPEQFAADFDRVFSRLNDLRLRRLSDETDEIELGLAYGFPEEWRLLLPGLQTYLRTLFPLIRQPRVVRNLVFRGTYFTSATQEGSLILRHLTERLGAEAAGQFAPLDLYPNKRPHFIKDLLFRKVLPEHGLVFRNEQQVIRNRQWARVLRWGSVALFVLLVGTLVFSSRKFHRVINEPRAEVSLLGEAKVRPPKDALDQAVRLDQHIETLERNRAWAALLSWGWGTRQPIEDLQAIRTGLFTRFVLPDALAQISTALRAGTPTASNAEVYLESLRNYLAWSACAEAPAPAPGVTAESLISMTRLVSETHPLLASGAADFVRQADSAFVQYALSPALWGNPAKYLALKAGETEGRMDGSVTAIAALRQAHEYFKPLATLDPVHPDSVIAAWMSIQRECLIIEERYNALLAIDKEYNTLRTSSKLTVESVEKHVDSAAQHCGEILKSVQNLRGVSFPNVKLKNQVAALRSNWANWQEKFVKAVEPCGSTSEGLQSAVKGFMAGDRELDLEGLDVVLCQSAKRAKLIMPGVDCTTDTTSWLDGALEIPEAYPHVVHNKSGPILADELARFAQVLESICPRRDSQKWTDQPLSAWISELEPGDPPQDADLSALDAAYWQTGRFQAFRKSHLDWTSRIDRRKRLLSFNDGLVGLQRESHWGLAEWEPEFESGVPSRFSIPLPQRRNDRQPLEASSDRKPPGVAPLAEKKGIRELRKQKGAPARAAVVAVPSGGGQVPTCATPAFILEQFDSSADGLFLMNILRSPEDYLNSPNDAGVLAAQCATALRGATEGYFRKYVNEWLAAYQEARLNQLDYTDCKNWKCISRKCEAGPCRDIANELRGELEEILEALSFWHWEFTDGHWAANANLGSAEAQGVWLWWTSVVEANRSHFILNAVPPENFDGSKQNVPPWSALGGEFARRWIVLGEAIAANVDLAVPRGGKLTEIPWGRIQELRNKCGLVDERLTGELVLFEQRAQELLSAELTLKLSELQSRYFGTQQAKGGWPYVERAGDPLATVEFDKFREFLLEVGRTEVAFAPLEAGLPKETSYESRRAFYRQCDAWRRLLGIDKGDTGPSKLENIKVTWNDPTMVPAKPEINDSPQHFFEKAILEIGFDGKPMEFSTLRQENSMTPQSVAWSWSKEQKPIFVSLVQGKSEPSSLRVEVGKSSPLALFAYLQKFEAPQGDGWLAWEAFPDFQHPQLKLIGVAFKFTFPADRALPKPIVPITAP